MTGINFYRIVRTGFIADKFYRLESSWTTWEQAQAGMKLKQVIVMGDEDKWIENRLGVRQ